MALVRGRALVAAMAAVGLLAAGVLPAGAAGHPAARGAAAPAEAVPVEYGVTYSGDNAPTATEPAGRIDSWRIGGAGKGSQVVVDVTNDSPTSPQSVCLRTGEPPAWSPGADWCTLSAAVSVPPGTTRVTLTTLGSTYVAHLAFGDPGTGAVGPYRFTVVEQRFLLTVDGTDPTRVLHRRADLQVQVSMGGEGEYPAPRGSVVTVVVTRADGRAWTRTAITRGWRALVPLRLPRAALGRAMLSVTAARDGYVTSAPLTRRVRIR